MNVTLKCIAQHNRSIILLILLFVLQTTSSYSQSDFSRALDLIVSDYPNYPVGITKSIFVSNGYQLLAKFNNDTFVTLCHIVDQFNDPHLAIVEPNHFSGIVDHSGKNVPNSNLKSSRDGMYINEYGNSILSIIVTGRYIDGYILKSSDSTLAPNFHILSGEMESPNVYYGSYIDEFSKKKRGGRFEFQSDTEFTTGAYSKWKKIKSHDSSFLLKSALEAQLSFPIPGVAFVSIPCSDSRCKQILDSIITVNQSQIRATETLILDLRKNVGGISSVIDNLLPFIYTKPIVKRQSAFYCTKTDLEESRQELKILSLKGSDDKDAVAAWKDWIKTESSNLGKFIYSSADTITFPEVMKNPSQVHVIIDYSNQSAAELIIMMLKQSSKVTTWGERTHGGVDYLDYRPLKLVTDKYLLYMPTSKRILPEHGVLYDNVGIYPDKSLRIMPDSLKKFIRQ